MKESTTAKNESIYLHNPDARSLAVQVLMHVSHKTPLQASLDTGLKNTTLHYKDHSLCTELCYGTMRYFFRLDAVLDSLLKKRSSLPEEMFWILRVAAYALLYLDRVPHHATVNWAVGVVKKRFGDTLSKVCNGVLRSLIRLENAPHEEAYFSKAHDYFATPLWMYDLLVQNYGKEHAHKILLRSLDRPKIAVRLNPQHAKFEELKVFFAQECEAQSVGWSGFVFLQKPCPKEALGLSMIELHDKGAFSWQAAGSQHVLKTCFDAVPDLKFSPLWDACAGQGGKSLALIEQGLEVPLASDTSISRLSLLRDTARRLKIECPEVICANATKPLTLQWEGNILLDVPCSGFGTLARRPEIRMLRTQNDVTNLMGTQKKILQNAFDAIQVGQFIVYMTCTLNPAENETMIAKFLKTHAQCSEKFSWQTPHEHPYLEGMFVSVLQKTFA